VKRHFRNHWKHYILIILAIIIGVVAYRFSNEIVKNVRQINQNVLEFVTSQYESKRKLFGEYAELAHEAFEKAKQSYLEDTPAQPVQQQHSQPNQQHAQKPAPTSREAPAHQRQHSHANQGGREDEEF